MPRVYHIASLKEKLLKGDVGALGSAITLIESTLKSHRILASQLIDELLLHTGNSLRIGITGVPGVGKSTFIETFGMYLVEQGKKVAVLAIDPSSVLNKGSILGDKTRMERLSVHPHAFIRPTASGGSLGGVAYRTREVMLLCEAAGFDVIMVETVGVGQSEVEVSQLTDFFLLLMLAGAGDELQGIKRGIMEIADGLVITKADNDNLDKAKVARSAYSRALHFLPPKQSGWTPKVITCSAYTGHGIGESWNLIEKFVRQQSTNNYFEKRRQEQNLFAFQRLLNEELKQYFLSNTHLLKKLSSLEQQVTEGKLSPYSAVEKLISHL